MKYKWMFPVGILMLAIMCVEAQIILLSHKTEKELSLSMENSRTILSLYDYIVRRAEK